MSAAAVATTRWPGAAALTWAFGPGDPRRLAGLRIGLGAILTMRLTTRAGLFLSLPDQSPELYRPLSYMRVLHEMPSRPAILACLVVGIVAAALATAGLLARTTLAIGLLAALLLNGMYTAQGKIMHNDVLLMLCLLAIVPSRHADVWSLDARRARRRSPDGAPPASSVAYGWPVRAAMLIVVIAYFFAGLHKVIGSGGLGWASSDNMRWLLYASSDAHGGNAAALWIADSALMSHVAAYGLLATELLFFLVLPWPRLRWVFLPAAVAMHAGTWITLGLDYSAQLLTVVVVFVTWPTVVAAIAARRRTRLAR